MLEDVLNSLRQVLKQSDNPEKQAKTLTNIHVDETDSNGVPLLHQVVDSTLPDKKELLRLLLEHPDINVNISESGNAGNTALMLAILNNDVLATEILLDTPNLDVNSQNTLGVLE